MRGAEFAELTAFLEVAEAGGFARAAAHLGVTPSAISQSVRQLEDRLAVRLFNRTTRSVALTEAGERLKAALQPVMAALNEAAQAVQPYAEGVKGHLRITASRVAATLILAPRLPLMRLRHPGLTLEVSVEDRSIDIVRNRFDAGIRRGDLVDKDMVGRRLTPDEPMVVVTSGAYLAREGRPAQPRDLLAHDCIRIRRRASEATPPWRFVEDGTPFDLKVTGGLVVDDATLAKRAACAGAGLAYLAASFIREEIESRSLVAVLEPWQCKRAGFFLYYPTRLRNPPALRVLVESLIAAPA